MKEARICIYCKEVMKYGPRPQVRYRYIYKDGKIVGGETTEVIEYGWACKFKDDDCDFIKDYNVNTGLDKEISNKLSVSINPLHK